jgi:hypothetical protein
MRHALPNHRWVPRLGAILLIGGLGGCGCSTISGPDDDTGPRTTRASSEMSTTVPAEESTGGDQDRPNGNSPPSVGGSSTQTTTPGSSATTPTSRSGSAGLTTTTAGEDPDGDPGGGGPPSEPIENQYEWGLPIGDWSVNTTEALVFEDLENGRCDSAQGWLDSPALQFRTPRSVPLYQAGIHLCRGDRAMASQAYAEAASYGWAGLVISGYYPAEKQLDCLMYQAVRSVLEQRPPSSFGCAQGTPPEWPETTTDSGTEP